MIKLEFTTVIGCKNMCKYCPQAATLKNYKGGEKRVMSLEDFKTCVDKAPPNAEIAFSGFAEPFLNPKFMEMLEYAYAKHHPVSLYTTLVGASLEDIGRLGKIHYYDFVLHLPDKDMVLEINAEYLEKLRTAAQLEVSVSNDYYAVCFAEIDPRVREAIGTKIKLLDLAVPHSRAGYVKKTEIHRTGRITCRKCGNGLNQNIILPDGSVILCCMDFGLKHVFGNLLTQDYAEIQRSAEKKRAQAGLSDPKIDILCRTCESSISLTGDGPWGTLLYINSRIKAR